MTTQNDIRELRKIRDQEKQVMGLLIHLIRRKRELMIQLKDGGVSLERIGKICFISKQRVSQIIQRGLVEQQEKT